LFGKKKKEEEAQ